MVLTAVLEVLDITIVNVAIPHMLGAFGATTDQITWVLTSYIVSAAVVMPLTGYLSTWLGRRRLLLVAICGFVLSSALCGMAWNLESMVVFRLAQGIFGAPLVPSSQAILLDAFPRERHGQALAIFGLGIMVAPVIGPVLGGYLTETYSLAHGVLHQRADRPVRAAALDRLSAAARHQGHQDRLGRHGALGARGRRPAIRARSGPDARLVQLPPHRSSATIVTVFATAAFFLRGWNKPDNIIDLSLLKDRNFVAGTLAITAYGISLFGWMALMPLLSQRLLGYPPAMAGTLFIPRARRERASHSPSPAASSFDCSIRATSSPRVCVMTALGTILMSHYSLICGLLGHRHARHLAGIGTGLFFVPLTAVAFGSIAEERNTTRPPASMP